MDTHMKLNAERLRALRDGRGWSQEHLAAAAGVSVRTIQRAESDGAASRETKVCLAAALGVPHSELEARQATLSSERQLQSATNVSVFVHQTIGKALLVAGICILGTGLLAKHRFNLGTYLGSFFALVGLMELAFALVAKRTSARRARSVA